MMRARVDVDDVTVVGGTATGSDLPLGPRRLLPLGSCVAVVAVDGGVGDRPAGFAVGIELGVARPERLLRHKRGCRI